MRQAASALVAVSGRLAASIVDASCSRRRSPNVSLSSNVSVDRLVAVSPVCWLMHLGQIDDPFARLGETAGQGLRSGRDLQQLCRLSAVDQAGRPFPVRELNRAHHVRPNNQERTSRRPFRKCWQSIDCVRKRKRIQFCLQPVCSPSESRRPLAFNL